MENNTNLINVAVDSTAVHRVDHSTAVISHEEKLRKDMEFAKSVSMVFDDFVRANGLAINIPGGQAAYVKAEGWQFLRGVMGHRVSIESCDIETIVVQGKEISGYRAVAVVLDRDGRVLSRAVAHCFENEKIAMHHGQPKPFIMASMAQTRACAKASRNDYGYIAKLAGYESTPFEEMSEVDVQSANNAKSEGATEMAEWMIDVLSSIRESVMDAADKKKINAEAIRRLGKGSELYSKFVKLLKAISCEPVKDQNQGD
jgi:hypothetical protein